jgi:glycosyltransferase involved in cell wall biosynthesis
VIVSVYDWGSLHPRLKELQNKGAKIIVRKRIFYGNSIRARAKGLIVKKLFSANEIIKLAKYKPDILFISQGTIYECMQSEFYELQIRCNAKSFIITQANAEYETLPLGCRAIGKNIFRNATKTYFVSNRNRIVAERQLALLLPNSEVISNPINLIANRQLNWNNSETVRFACVGRLDSTVKGLGVLFQILGDTEWKTRNWNLELYGKGEDQQYLIELTEMYGISKKIQFKGHVNDVAQIWEKNHLLLMPSTLEGTPLALIEAMYCGRIAVVSDVGGNAEMIKEGINGFVAEAPSVYSFGNALNRMCGK